MHLIVAPSIGYIQTIHPDSIQVPSRINHSHSIQVSWRQSDFIPRIPGINEGHIQVDPWRLHLASDLSHLSPSSVWSCLPKTSFSLTRVQHYPAWVQSGRIWPYLIWPIRDHILFRPDSPNPTWSDLLVLSGLGMTWSYHRSNLFQTYPTWLFDQSLTWSDQSDQIQTWSDQIQH